MTLKWKMVWVGPSCSNLLSCFRWSKAANNCYVTFLSNLCPQVFWSHPDTSVQIVSPPETAAAKSLQSCPTLCDPIDDSPPGSTVPEILQARTLEWVAISFSNAWKWKVKGKSLSHVQLFMTPWTAAHQAPPSMGFSRQEYWSGVPLPSPNPEVLDTGNWPQPNNWFEF